LDDRLIALVAQECLIRRIKFERLPPTSPIPILRDDVVVEVGNQIAIDGVVDLVRIEHPLEYAARAVK
jgi:hypothetical protein